MDVGDPHVHEIACKNPECGKKIEIWRHELKAGNCWSCPDCGGRNIIGYGLTYEPPADKAAQSAED